MPYTLTQRTNLLCDGSGISGERSASADSLNKREIELPTSAANLPILEVLDVSQMNGVVLLCTADATLKTNSAGSPADTIELLAGEDRTWLIGQGANPFTVDVTQLFATCTDGGTLTMWFLFDPTI